MPVENPEQPLPERDHNNWQRLAEDARNDWDLEHPGVAALYENHVVPLLHGKGLGHLAITAEDKAGGRFLHKYGNVDQKEVNHVINYLQENNQITHEQANKSGDRTAAYLKFMTDTANDGILTGDPESVERQINRHVITHNDVPESYFALQRRIAREQGHGDIEITPSMKNELIEAAQADQRGSLDKWVEYLGGEDGSYPDWFKRYTWDSVVKLGAYDKEKSKFDRRDSSTVAPYPELNREALAYVFDTVNKFHVLGEQQVDDAKLKQLLKEGSFGRLYAHAVGATSPDNPELLTDIRGSWKKYSQSNDPRVARHLSGSLQGHGTGWCTAGESTAAVQLGMGDFYVYYTRDEDGKDKVPRIAIRMQYGEVAEVRGVNAAQELEPALVDIASDQLQDLPGGEEYIKRAADMKHLTAIDNLLSKDPHAELSAEDVAFLYELRSTIKGFGYDDDPRVEKLQLKAANTRTAELLEHIDPDAAVTKQVRNHVRVHELMSRASQDEYSMFSDDELSFIYGLNGPIVTLIPDDSELGKAIDYWHGGRDRERLVALMPSVFERQYMNSLNAYEATTGSLGIEAANTELLQREFAAKLQVWQEQGVYQYLLEQLIENDTQFKLVMTPNVLASKDQIVKAVKAFAQSQSETTSEFIFDELYDQYSSEELSGAQDQGVAVRFSLVPNRQTPELGMSSVEEQLVKLRQLKDNLPHLNIRVPSVLDAISFWQSLRLDGLVLSGASNGYQTSIRHIDLSPKRIDENTAAIPLSFLNHGLEPWLSDSHTTYPGVARIMVG